MESRYITKDGKRLRLGYTTGSCAAGAAKAAVNMLLSGKQIEKIKLMTPVGIGLILELLDIQHGEGFVSCAVRKDSGDDPDVTNGILVYAKVSKTNTGVTIDGGEGIGRVTKPGLNRPVGAAAINTGPMMQIKDAVISTASEFGYAGGFNILIYAPEGTEIAKRTFNPRLGIEGGISILGTSGIVEPMSDASIVETIKLEMNRIYLDGSRYLLLAPGNIGKEFLQNRLRADEAKIVKCSNFIGESLSIAQKIGFKGMLLAGHIGKLVKLAGGIMNTHSRYGDCRMEIIAAHAGMFGGGAALIREIMLSATTDEALRLLYNAGLNESVVSSIISKIAFHMKAKVLNETETNETETGVIMFSSDKKVLGMTDNAMGLLKNII